MTEQFDLFSDQEETPPPTKREADLKAPRVLYFDLETQKGSTDVGGWGNIHLMKLAVGVVWDSLEKEYFTYLEDQAEQLVEKLSSADLVVGFNVIGFDYTVLQPYASIDLQEINTFDMIIDVKKHLGFRLSLNHLAHETLQAEKSADGLVSLQWYKEGKMDKIIKYCKQDVAITRDLFLYGEEHGHVLYKSRSGQPLKLEVDWKTSNFVS